MGKLKYVNMDKPMSIQIKSESPDTIIDKFEKKKLMEIEKMKPKKDYLTEKIKTLKS